MKKAKTNNEIKIGAILSYVIIALNMIIGIAYTPILTGSLGKSEYGLYSLVSSIMSYLTILDFGFGNAIIVYTARYKEKGEKEKEAKLHGMFFIIYTIIGIIAGIIGTVLCFNAENLFGNTMTNAEIQKAKILMGILTFNLIITFSFSIFSSIITAYEKFIFAKILNICRIVLSPIIMLVLLQYGYKSIALVSCNTVLNVGVLLLNYWYCKNKIKINLNFKKIDWFFLKTIMTYSIWIFLNSIIDKVAPSLSQFILGTVSGTNQVAIYAVAIQIFNIYMSFSGGISGVLLPKITKMQVNKASDKDFSDIFIRTGRLQYILMALVLSGFILYGRQFINLMWVGPEYDQSYFVTCILIIPLTIPLIQNVGLNILQVKNQYKFRVIALLIITTIDVGVSIVLGKKYGSIGVAIGTALTYILGTGVFLNTFYHKKTKINIIEFWKNIFKMTIPIIFLIIFGILLKNIMPITNVYTLVVEIIIYTVAYVIVMWKFSLNDYEKNLIMTPINMIKKRRIK